MWWGEEFWIANKCKISGKNIKVYMMLLLLLVVEWYMYVALLTYISNQFSREAQSTVPAEKLFILWDPSKYLLFPKKSSF